MGIDGVRSINNVQLGQGTTSTDLGQYWDNPLWDNTGIPGIDVTSTGTNAGYGWFYDFSQFYDGTTSSDGIILPSIEPSIWKSEFTSAPAVVVLKPTIIF